MPLVYAALIAGAFSLILFYLQGRRDRHRMVDAWELRAEALHQELRQQYQQQIDTQQGQLTAKDELLSELLNRNPKP